MRTTRHIFQRWAPVFALVLSLVAPAPAPARGGLDVRPANPTCLAPATGPEVDVTLVPALGGAILSEPTAARQSPLDPDLWLVTERVGRLRRVDEPTGAVATALDLSARVAASNEGGLLGLALHPDFAGNGFAYVYYTIADAPLRTIVSRFSSLDGGQSFDPASEQVILDLPQFATNHLGGDIHFGPDGMLYVALGDGTRVAYAQDTSRLHGKLLRLDVDAGSPYAIPWDNPFAAGGGLPEIWALGFRNPYRFSFDAHSGELWLADVGWLSYEEVDLVTRGGNYGWGDREGFHCRTASCTNPSQLDPELEYTHEEGCAVLGGFVYRGSALPGLSGAYLYGDYCAQQIWSALPDGNGGYQVEPLALSSRAFIGFAQARDGEVLVLQTQGAARLAPAAGSQPEAMPLHLADTGCVDPADPKRPAAGLIPFEVNAPLWSDGAAKERWLALPDGARIGIGADGDFTLPPGSVTMKSFRLRGKLVETRLFVRHGDGSFGGYSYEWNDAQTDAVLLPGAKQRELGDQTWSYPSRAQCLHCHTAAAGRSLGLELGQLNREAFYPGTARTADQLATLAQIGVFDAPLAPSGALPRIERDTEDHAVRGWLHANCAGCHRPGGPTGAGLDLRYASALAELGACDVAPALGDLGVTGAKLLLPGDPARSLLSLRVQLTGAGQMPPLARALVDSAGSAALERWIRSFPSCSGPDGDGDGRVDTADNCPRTANASQTDSDGDGIGDACETACRNGLDDDGDGAADHPLDPGCASAGAASESPACDDGIDNDGDGLVDGPLDIGCAGASATRENPPCADGLDNDRDRRIDFDGGRWLGLAAPTAADPHCGGRPSADFEAPGCGLGLELVPLLGLVAALRWRRARRA